MIPALLGLYALADEPRAYGQEGVDLGFAACQRIERAEQRVEAQSTLSPSHGTTNLLDGKPHTAGCEGAEGPGKGATVRLTWNEPQVLYALGPLGGFSKSEALLQANVRPLKPRIQTRDDRVLEVALDNPAVPRDSDPSLPLAMGVIPPKT